MLLKDGRELTVRKAAKSDAAEIIDYLNTIGAESDNLLFGAEGFGMTNEQEAEYIENCREPSALLVGVLDGRIVSIGHISTLTRQRVAHLGEVGISVLKEFWGIGVGTCMMNEIIKFSKESGVIEVLHLGAKAENTRAIELYKKTGFREIGRFPGFFKIDGKYYDEIKMNLYL